MQTSTTEVSNVERLLLESGSQRTNITESLAKRIGLKSNSEQEVKLVTFGRNKTKTIKTKCAMLKVKLLNGEMLEITANIVPTISGSIQRNPLVPTKRLEHLVKRVELVDAYDKGNTKETSTILFLLVTTTS